LRYMIYFTQGVAFNISLYRKGSRRAGREYEAQPKRRRGGGGAFRAHNLRGQQMTSPRPWKIMKYFHSTVRNPS